MLKCDTGAYLWYSVTKINRSVGSLLEFQQNDPQNRQKKSDTDE